MFAAFLPLALILAAGLVYRIIPGVPAASDVRRVIGSIVLNIFLPALTFFALYTAPLDRSLWTVPLTSLFVTSVGFGLAYLVYGIVLRKRLSGATVAALILAAGWCNATYLGLPVVTSVVGAHVQQVPILFDLLAMTPLLFIVSPLLANAFATSSDVAHHSPLRQLVRLPPLWAAVIGLTLNVFAVGLPDEFLKAFEVAGRTVSPLMIFSIGLALRLPRPERIVIILPSVLIRLVVGALAGVVIGAFLIDDHDIYVATVLESAMPTMMLTMVFAERYGFDVEVLAEAIVLSTLCAMLTLPIIASLL